MGRKKRQNLKPVPKILVDVRSGSMAAQEGSPSNRGSYQSPHEQAEQLQELTDDLAPHTSHKTTPGNWINCQNQLASPIAGSIAGGLLSSDSQPNSMKQQEVLEGLPSEIKIVVQEKMRTFATVKKPFIMPSTSHELPKPGIGKPSAVFADGHYDDDVVEVLPSTGAKRLFASKSIAVRLSTDDRNFNKKMKTNNTPSVVMSNQHQSVQQRDSGNANVINVETISSPGNRSKPNEGVQVESSAQGPKPNPQPLQRTSQRSGFNYTGPVARFPSGIPRSFYAPPDAQSPAQPTSQYNFPNWEAGSFQQSTGLWLPPADITPVENMPVDNPPQYSPTDAYTANEQDDTAVKDIDGGGTRLSAFQRLGPQQDKPKLTINLLTDKEQPVRKVLRACPVHEREEVVCSRDPVVQDYRKLWPWQRTRHSTHHVTHRTSKSVMLLEKEQMEEIYDKEHQFILVNVKGYPTDWTKEQVLDLILDVLHGKHFIPVFIDFNADECKFLVLRSRVALFSIHKMGFKVHKDDVCLIIIISVPDITLNTIDFVPRLILKKILSEKCSEDLSLNLKEFTLQPDLSNFIYFPLNRVSNQAELVQLPSNIAWDYLTKLDLSYNRISSLEGLNLVETTPRLRHLDLSHNQLCNVRELVSCRGVPLRQLLLQGNPLCRDHTAPEHYIRLMKMLFPALTHLDGCPLHVSASAEPRVGWSGSGGATLAALCVRRHFALLEPENSRHRLHPLYHAHAALTLTHTYTRVPCSRSVRNLFSWCRSGAGGGPGPGSGAGDTREAWPVVHGATDIVRHVTRWPDLRHDPTSFTVDILYHNDTVTIFRVCGMMKVTSESLADDEHLIWFTRSMVLVTEDGIEYKIKNEMITWSEPTPECADAAFQMIHTRPKAISLALDSTPNEDLKDNLIFIFKRLTDLDKQQCKNCLEKKSWNLKTALEYFMSLLKLNDLSSLKSV